MHELRGLSVCEEGNQTAVIATALREPAVIRYQPSPLHPWGPHQHPEG